MEKELYIFSGLGADERAFQLCDFSGFKTHYIKWIAPQVNESIEHYANRLLEQIPAANSILIGMSFGGFMAIEVAKQIVCSKVILIASAKNRKEIPWYYRLAGQLGLHKLLPTKLLKSANPITNWFFGTTSTFDKQLLKEILVDTDPIFLSWAIDKVVHWKNQSPIKNVFHIHGSNDKILPLSFLNCNVTIKNGGHLMALNNADELNIIIRQQLLL